MATQYFSADFLYSENQTMPDACLAVENGVITALGRLAELTGELSPEQKKQIQHFSDAAIIPGLVNTHNHSFQSLLKGVCDDADFFTWRDQALYKYATVMTQEDLYTGALFAFGEMLKAGITTVCDFFYINDQANDNAHAVIQAAQDLGMRMVMARTMYNWEGAPKRFQESVVQAVNNTQALMAHYKNHPMVSVLPAPHSLHGASIEMIEAGATLAQEYQTMWHMHIAEGQYERQMMLDKTGHSPIAYLAQRGLLTQHLVGIHCVWLDDADIELMGQSGARLSYNPSSNMFLGDGITRIRELWDAGVCISLGTDGGCSNNRASILEEMRMTNLLQKVRFCDATQSKAEEAFLMGTVNGGHNLGLPIGKLAAGYAADFVVVDLNDLSMQPRAYFGKNLVYAAQPSALAAVFIAGKPVMQQGNLVQFSEQSILSQLNSVFSRFCFN